MAAGFFFFGEGGRRIETRPSRATRGSNRILTGVRFSTGPRSAPMGLMPPISISTFSGSNENSNKRPCHEVPVFSQTLRRARHILYSSTDGEFPTA
jgi:hypothetical protein